MRLSENVASALGYGRFAFGLEDGSVSAAELADAGATALAPFADGGCVAAILTNDSESISVVLGAIVTGLHLISLPAPSRGADLAQYQDFLAAACRAYSAPVAIVRDDLASLLPLEGVRVVGHGQLGKAGKETVDASSEFRLTQFSSGSTGAPAGITLSDEDLGTNIASIIERVRPRPGDATVSWLPLSHDMGLVGMVLTSLVASNPTWVGRGVIALLTPEQFLRSPRLWLDALDHWGGTFTAAPTFGFQLAADRAAGIDGLRLDRVRCAIVGGDIVRAGTLRAVEAHWAALGFGADALCPGYGMAEIGLCATLTAPGERWRSRTVSRAGLVDGRLVPGLGPDAVEIVASGRPVTGCEVIVDGEIGGIGLRPPAAGRLVDGSSCLDEGGMLSTGDVGFTSDDGWLSVCGRTDDFIVALGRLLYAPALEQAVDGLAGVRTGRSTVVSDPLGRWAVVYEVDPRSDLPADDVREAVRRCAVATFGLAPNAVLPLGPGQLPMTSSGKSQRSKVWRLWASGQLD